MSGTHRTCEICGLREITCVEKVFFARFPLDVQRCAEWVKIVGKEDLAYLSVKKLHDLRHICEIHFAKRDFTKSGIRLKKRAVPKLHLTRSPLADNLFTVFLEINSNGPSTSHCQNENLAPYSTATDQNNMELAKADSAVPSTSREVLDSLENQPKKQITTKGAPVPVYSITAVQTEKRPLSAIDCNVTDPAVPSTSKQVLDSTENNPKRMKNEKAVSGPVNSMTVAQKEKKRPLSSIECDLNDPVVPSTSRPVFDSFENKPKRRKITKEDLNPRELELYEQLCKAKATIKSLKKSAKLMNSIDSPFLKEIVEMTVKNQRRKPRGRRWTTKYKISLLAIFKRSPKTYKYLNYLVPVPTVTTIQRILKNIPMEPGICQDVLSALKKQCPQNPQDRACCLMFDEMAIKPRLLYNNISDKVEGFTDYGNGERTKEMADHALVFMLQGLKKKFKQPVAFYFVKGTVSSSKLASLIKDIIHKLNETGFNVIATICDQGSTNMGALKILNQSSMFKEITNNKFIVNDKQIFTIYDVPHLFKSIRNNFLNYGAVFFDDKMAKWEHLKNVEERNRNFLYLSKVSQIHVQPKYRAKMKVKYAAQILSNTVAAVLKLISMAEKDPVKAKEFMDTADVIQQLDKLFDYTNGPSGPDDIKKGQRTNVSNKTDHLEMWTQLRKKITAVKFLKLATGCEAKNVRCIKGYLVTLESLRDIWAECKSLGFKYLNLRQLNQDALENLFGVIRQHSPTNRNPTVAGFVAAMKTAIVSKLTAPHSRGANCQKNSNKLLTDFHDIVFSGENNVLVQEEQSNIMQSNISGQDNSDRQNFPVLNIPDWADEEEEVVNSFINLDKQPVAYISGYIAYRLLKINKCAVCRETLTTTPEEAANNHLFEYIRLREWWDDKQTLTYPSKNLFLYVKSSIQAFEKHVLEIMHTLNIRLAAITIFFANMDDYPTLGCNEHRKNVIDTINADLAIMLIRRQCERINKNISLEEEKKSDAAKKAEQRGKPY